MTFTKVNGFQSFNNDLFTINSSTGEITLNSAQSEGRYYLRYRATRNDNILQYSEDVMILDVASETSPSGSSDNTYTDSVSTGDILATITSTFSSPSFELQPLTASLNPASAYETSQALEVDSSGNIRWTGNISASTMKNYKVRAVARNGGMGCFSGTEDIEINYEMPVPEFPAAPCAYPGLLAYAFNNNDPIVNREYEFEINHGSAQPVDYDVDAVGAFMNQPNPCIPANQIEICGSDSNGSALNSVQRRAGGDGARIIRGFLELNVGSASQIIFRVRFGGTVYTTSFKPKARIFYKLGNIAGSNPNETYDMPGWIPIGEIVPTHNVSSYVYYEIDASNLLPENAFVNIGILLEGEYDNNYQPWIDASAGGVIEGNVGILQRYLCS